MKNKKNIRPILRAIILFLALIPIVEICARRGDGSRKSGVYRPSARPNRTQTPRKSINRPSQQPSTRPNVGVKPGGSLGNIPEQPGNRPNRPGRRPNHRRPGGRPNHRPIVRPGRRPINIYAGGYGYGGYYNGYYNKYDYDTVGTIKYAILDKTRGSAPNVYCNQACSEQQGLNWNGNAWCDETACYCECSI